MYKFLLCLFAAILIFNSSLGAEPTGISRNDGKRPDGMSLVPWNMGRVLVSDATCVDTLAPSHLHRTSKRAGAAAEAAESIKDDDVCCQPKVVGPCRAAILRYYFDTDENQCKEFRYGGCQGNDNRFETLEDCKATCET